MSPTHRSLVIVLAAVAAAALVAIGVGWVWTSPRPPAGASPAARRFDAYCADCHGVDGRGSWRARVFLIHPGDLADPRSLAGYSDQYVFDIIKHGGSPIGRPGMPAFGEQLSDDEIRALVAYVRSLSTRPPR